MKNQIVFEGDVAKITLTQGYFATIDKADVEKVTRHRWCAQTRKRRDGSIKVVYAICSVSQPDGTYKSVYMHRLLVEDPKDFQVDHADADGLNNRRFNLRVCSTAENQHNMRRPATNTSGYKGISRAGAGWHAKIRIDGTRQYLGYYRTPEEAARAYDAAAKSLHKSFARLNFPDTPDTPDNHSACTAQHSNQETHGYYA